MLTKNFITLYVRYITKHKYRDTCKLHLTNDLKNSSEGIAVTFEWL